MLAVARALEMAVKQCERISGTSCHQGKNDEVRQAATIAWPMLKMVNVSTDSQQVFDPLMDVVSLDMSQ